MTPPVSSLILIENYLCISVCIFRTPLNIKVKTFTDTEHRLEFMFVLRLQTYSFRIHLSLTELTEAKLDSNIWSDLSKREFVFQMIKTLKPRKIGCG